MATPARRRSIFRRTNYMHSVITCQPSSCLAQLIPIRRKLYCNTSAVSHSSDPFLFQGEQAHRTIKRFYANTNKKMVPEQLAKQERRHTHLRQQDQEGDPPENNGELDAPLPDSLRYMMASSTQNFTNLAKLLADNSDDPATRVMLLRNVVFHKY